MPFEEIGADIQEIERLQGLEAAAGGKTAYIRQELTKQFEEQYGGPLAPGEEVPAGVGLSALSMLPGAMGFGGALTTALATRGGVAVAPAIMPGAAWQTAIAPAAAGMLGGAALGGAGGGIWDFLQGLIGQAPWETPTGEGFMAPWTTDVLLPNGQRGQLGKGYPSIGILKSWSNGPGGSKGNVVFFKMMNKTVIYNVLTSGAWGKYRPKKHIVISSDPRLSNIRKLDRAHKRVTKMVAKFAPKAKRAYGQVPSRLLSPAEKALIKA